VIEGNDSEGYALYCDNCGDACDEIFDTFSEAVDWKTERGNGWRSIKGKYDEWHEVCPQCNQPDIIAEIKGQGRREEPVHPAAELARIAALNEAEFEGF